MNAEGNTKCRVAKWADGHRQKHDEELKDEWNNQHSWVGKKVEKMFDNDMYTGTITLENTIWGMGTLENTIRGW